MSSTHFDTLAEGFSEFEVPQEAVLTNVFGEALDAHAGAQARLDTAANDVQLALVEAVEQFLGFHKGTAAYDDAGLNGERFARLLKTVGGEHD
ncbi:MAG: hypothetical protein ACFB2Z_04170 [Maricaulaceae bacterium]